MTDPRPRHSPGNRLASGPALSLSVASLLILGACSPGIPTPASSAPASVSAEPSPLSSASATSSAAPLTGQTDTDWGRIWDRLPAAFPVYPGATPAAETQTGPVSATFALSGSDAKAVATWMKTELERAAYATESLTGPLEDGSFVLDSVGAAGCRVEVAAAPLGAVTTVMVRYGAACPSP